MDCLMPEMDGWTATRQIRSGMAGVLNPAVPIVALTASVLNGDRARCLEAGMDDYLPKPLQPAALAELLGRWSRHEPRAFERRELVRRLGGNVALAKNVADSFLADVPERIQELHLALTGGNVAKVRSLAHQIKGAAAAVGGPAVQRVAGAMEAAVVSGQLDKLAALAPQLDTEFGRLRTSLADPAWAANFVTRGNNL
jgi:CheY-like chemotaxis protein